MTPDVPDQLAIDVPGLPEGVRARLVPVSSTDQRPPLTRRGTIKEGTPIELVATTLPPDALSAPSLVDLTPGLSERDARFIMARDERTWPKVEEFLGERATSVVVSLVRQGVVRVRAQLTSQQRLAGFIRWRLEPQWQALAQKERSGRRTAASSWKTRAEAAAEVIAELDPGLAASLRSRPGSQSGLDALVYAAEDLAAGRSHDGPKTFCQVHWHNTKHVNIARRLREAGAADSTLLALGVATMPSIGLAGPITIHAWRPVDLGALQGPVVLPLPTGGYQTSTTATVTVIVENEEAARTITRRWPTAAIIWTPGRPSIALLRTIAGVLHTTHRVVLIPDADLGGLLIVREILRSWPAIVAPPDVLDVGQREHIRGEPFDDPQLRRLRQLTISAEPIQVRQLAEAFHAREYRIEQEEAVVRAVEHWLHSVDLPTSHDGVGLRAFDSESRPASCSEPNRSSIAASPSPSARPTG